MLTSAILKANNKYKIFINFETQDVSVNLC